jgi:hypothetical protein
MQHAAALTIYDEGPKWRGTGAGRCRLSGESKVLS